MNGEATLRREARHDHIQAEDPRTVLGLSPEAGLEEIRKAYRRLARELHPDTARSSSAGTRTFSAITLAYRQLLEEFSETEGPCCPEAHTSHETPFRCRDGTYLFMDLSLEEAFRGGTASVQVADRENFCPRCNGAGVVPERTARACPECAGKGERAVTWGDGRLHIVCTECSGTGASVRVTCPICRGRGRVTGTRSVRVSFPPGTRDGSAIKMPGQGPWRPEFGRRDPLYVVPRVHLPPGWRIEGLDVMGIAETDIWTVLSGGRMRVKTVDGMVDAPIPAGTYPGGQIRLPGKGWTDETGNRGDHVADVRVLMPEGVAPEAAVPLLGLLRAVWPAGPGCPALPANKTG